VSVLISRIVPVFNGERYLELERFSPRQHKKERLITPETL